MENKREIIQRIPSWYVGEDCVQVMVPYKNAITILSKDGIVYHHKEGSNIFINKYLDDERRKQIPYHNIPMHYTKLYDGKYRYTNQLFEFEQPYIRINDGRLIESYVIKDKREVLAINNIIPFIKKEILVNRRELDELINKSSNVNETMYCVYFDGTMPIGNKFTIPNEREIREHVKKTLAKNAKDLREYVNENPYTVVGDYFEKDNSFLDFVDSSIENFELNQYNLRVPIANDDVTMIFVKTNGNDITLQGMDLYYSAQDCYKVTIYDIPVTKYTLEQLKFLTTKIEKTKEPKITIKDNPGVTKEDIKIAKRMIKQKKNS